MEIVLILEPADGEKNEESQQPWMWNLLQNAVNTMHENTSYLFYELAVVTLWLKTVTKMYMCYKGNITYKLSVRKTTSLRNTICHLKGLSLHCVNP